MQLSIFEDSTLQELVAAISKTERGRAAAGAALGMRPSGSTPSLASVLSGETSPPLSVSLLPNVGGQGGGDFLLRIVGFPVGVAVGVADRGWVLLKGQ